MAALAPFIPAGALALAGAIFLAVIAVNARAAQPKRTQQP